MKTKPNVLFVVQNNPIGHDVRVLGEAEVIAEQFASHVVTLSPRGTKPSAGRSIPGGNMTHYAYPAYEAHGIAMIVVEYLIAAFMIAVMGYSIVLRHKIRIIHVANPPDFLVPIFFPLRLFGVTIIYDQHDISTLLFASKVGNRSAVVKVLLFMLGALERMSIRLSRHIIFANDNFHRIFAPVMSPNTHHAIVRNNFGNYTNLEENVLKNVFHHRKTNGKLRLLYIGIITKDSGVDNLLVLAERLKGRIEFTIDVFGDGIYRETFRQQVTHSGLDDVVTVHGYRRVDQIYDSVLESHIGIIPLPDVVKNHVHTSSKIFDYLSLALPVFSLELKEQMGVAREGGRYFRSFEAMADSIAEWDADREGLNAIGHIGYQLFQELYHRRKNIEQLLTLYRTIGE
jgi:glycosyltransferase involved in cell wall biosynthesis